MKALLLHKWKFHYGDCPDAWFKGYQDSAWEEVSVPHDWSVHMPFSKENSSGTGYLPGGTGWYRTSFLLPESMRGKRIYITADGIYKNGQLWCNSYYLGKRPYGYSTFRYDITEQACFGDVPNLISVKVNHPDISDSRWFTGSGITRKVTISAEEPVHPDFQGIFFQTPAVTAKKADILVENTIKNDSGEEITVTVRNILSFGTNQVLSLENSTLVPAGELSTVINKGILQAPALWSPENPQLYQLDTEILAKSTHGSFACKMETAQSVGIRSIRFDPDKGFFLNEQPYKLKGVCVHHDAGCLGAAVLPEVWLRRLCYLKEMGCNAIRMSHNPHMPELYDLCDRMGFFAMDEAFDEWEGPKNKWSTGHNVYPPKHQGYYEDFPQWHKQDLTDLIKRDRNHPSIFAWSIGNEIDYPNDPYCHPLFTSMTGNNDKNKPLAEQLFNADRPKAERLSVLAKELIQITKQYDATRPVTSAVSFPELSSQVGFFDQFDIVGYNYKEEYYAEDHLRYPDKPFLGSENSHSYKAWKVVRDLEYISGQFLWTGIDFLGEAHGWPIHGSEAGVMTLAGFPKTSYFRRQSFWADRPVIYLVSARAEADINASWYDNNPEWKPMSRSWNYLPGEEIEIRCYTNMPCAELFCNQKSYGAKEFDDNIGYISWSIPYENGIISVAGYPSCSDYTAIARDTLETTGRSCSIELKPWTTPARYQTLLPLTDAVPYPSTGTFPFLKQIEATITDEAGRPVVNDSTMLTVQVSGDGTLIGLESGNQADNTEYNIPYRRAHEGRLLIYISCENDSLGTTVTVSGAGLKTTTITL
jgi:hypothetical protein